MNIPGTPTFRQRAVIAALTCFIPSAYAESLLFDSVSESIQTNAVENPIYRSRLKDPASLALMLVDRQSDVRLAIGEQVVLPLEKGLNVTVTLVSVEQPSPDLTFWHGTIAENTETSTPEKVAALLPSVQIIQYDDSITATVRYKGQLYQIMPISESLYTVIKEADRVAAAKRPE